MCGHTPGKVAGRQETVKAEMNGLTPGLDRSPPPRWMGGQGGQSLKVFGRTRSFWGLSSPKIEMGGKALKWLSRLDYPSAKTGEAVNGGAESAVHLDRCLAHLALLLPVRDGKTRWKTRLKMVDKSIGCVLYCATV